MQVRADTQKIIQSVLVLFKFSDSSVLSQKNHSCIITMLNGGYGPCNVSTKGFARISHFGISKKMPIWILHRNTELRRDCFSHQV